MNDDAPVGFGNAIAFFGADVIAAIIDPIDILVWVVLGLLARGWISLGAGALAASVGAIWLFDVTLGRGNEPVLRDGATHFLAYFIGGGIVLLIKSRFRKRPKPPAS